MNRLYSLYPSFSQSFFHLVDDPKSEFRGLDFRLDDIAQMTCVRGRATCAMWLWDTRWGGLREWSGAVMTTTDSYGGSVARYGRSCFVSQVGKNDRQLLFTAATVVPSWIQRTPFRDREVSRGIFDFLEDWRVKKMFFIVGTHARHWTHSLLRSQPVSLSSGSRFRRRRASVS